MIEFFPFGGKLKPRRHLMTFVMTLVRSGYIKGRKRLILGSNTEVLQCPSSLHCGAYIFAERSVNFGPSAPIAVRNAAESVQAVAFPFAISRVLGNSK